jgi:hypothetical protein
MWYPMVPASTALGFRPSRASFDPHATGADTGVAAAAPRRPLARAQRPALPIGRTPVAGRTVAPGCLIRDAGPALPRDRRFIPAASRCPGRPWSYPWPASSRVLRCRACPSSTGRPRAPSAACATAPRRPPATGVIPPEPRPPIPLGEPPELLPLKRPPAPQPAAAPPEPGSPAVIAEMYHPDTSEPVRRWAASAPPWLEIKEPTQVEDTPALGKRGGRERGTGRHRPAFSRRCPVDFPGYTDCVGQVGIISLLFLLAVFLCIEHSAPHPPRRPRRAGGAEPGPG